jgi:hypothetical protein
VDASLLMNLPRLPAITAAAAASASAPGRQAIKRASFTGANPEEWHLLTELQASQLLLCCCTSTLHAYSPSPLLTLYALFGGGAVVVCLWWRFQCPVWQSSPIRVPSQCLSGVLRMV